MHRQYVRTAVAVTALFVAVTFLSANVCAQDAEGNPVDPGESRVAGTLTPKGPPHDPPTRTDIGNRCVIDLRQSYEITGGLVGTIDVDYRILVFGTCGSTPGTFYEEWIAHGTFVGSTGGSSMRSNLVYTARVQAGGDVAGRIVLGEGLVGELEISGSFKDGRLVYSGHVR